MNHESDHCGTPPDTAWLLVLGALSLSAIVTAAVLLTGCAAPPVFVGPATAWHDETHPEAPYTLSQRIDYCRSAHRLPTATCHAGVALPATATGVTP